MAAEYLDFRDKWFNENKDYVDANPIEDGLLKFCQDAREEGVLRLEFPITSTQIIYDFAAKHDWISVERWGLWHLFLNLKAKQV